MSNKTDTKSRLKWFVALNGEDNIEERFLMVADACKTLDSYWTLNENMRKQYQELINDGIKVDGPIRQRTEHAENAMRILLKEGMDALNSWKECGLMNDMVHHTAAYPDLGDGFKAACTKTKAALEEYYPNTDFSFMEKIAAWQRLNKIEIKGEENGLRVKIRQGENQTRDFLIEDRPRPGFLGTIRSKDFFKPTKSGIIMSRSPFDAVTSGIQHSGTGVIDAYGAFVYGAQFAKYQMFRHRKQIDEQGISLFEGNAFAALIFAVVIGTLAIIAGITISALCSAGRLDLEADQCWMLAFILIAFGFGFVTAGGLGSAAGLFLVSSMAIGTGMSYGMSSLPMGA